MTTRSTIPVTNWYDGDDRDDDGDGDYFDNAYDHVDGRGDCEPLVLEGGDDRGTADSPSQPAAF